MRAVSTHQPPSSHVTGSHVTMLDPDRHLASAESCQWSIVLENVFPITRLLTSNDSHMRVAWYKALA